MAGAAVQPKQCSVIVEPVLKEKPVSKPKYVIFLTESDHNGVFSCPAFQKFLERIQTIASLAIENNIKNIDVLNDAFTRHVDADAIFLAGHGDPYTITLSDTCVITKDNCSKINFRLLHCRHIYVIACSVAKGVIPQTVAQTSGKVVVAVGDVLYPWQMQLRPSYRKAEELSVCFEGEIGVIFLPKWRF